jgi:hypothetical protein
MELALMMVSSLAFHFPTMKCHYSSPKLVGWIVFAFALFALCGWLITLPQLKAQIVGWFGTAASSALLVKFPIRFFRREPVLIFDESGVHDLRGSPRLFPWEDIAAYWVSNLKSTQFLCFDLLDREPYLASLSASRRMSVKMNISLGYGMFNFNFAGISPGLAQVWEHLLANRPDLAFASAPAR